MYNINGVNLNLDEELLERYSKLVVAPVGSSHFTESLAYLAEIALRTESFEKAIYLYGENVVSKKIAHEIEDELSFISVEYE